MKDQYYMHRDYQRKYSRMREIQFEQFLKLEDFASFALTSAMHHE